MVLKVAAFGGDINEVFGFVFRCALQSAGHTTDYVIDPGTAWMIGGPRTEELLELAVKAGYLLELTVDGITAFKLIEDPEFLHMKLRSEIDWEKQQRADNSNPLLTVPVRKRDGDACRYCLKICNWTPGARKGKLAGTYEHREPGKPATVKTMVVACGACNPSRRDDPDADERLPLQPPPVKPYYSQATAAFLARHGVTVTPTEGLRPGTYPYGVVRPGTRPDNAPDTAPESKRPVSADNLQNRPPGSADPRTRARTPAARAAGRDGTGKNGSGRDGTGQVGTGGRASPAKRRRRRGKRGRPPGGDQ
jgi:hypothetical protein